MLETGGIKDFFKGGGIKEGGDDKYPLLRTMEQD